MESPEQIEKRAIEMMTDEELENALDYHTRTFNLIFKEQVRRFEAKRENGNGSR